MNKIVEDNLIAVLKREGLEPNPGDLEQFAEIIELYMENLKQLHSMNLGAEELGPVFRPEWTGRIGRRKISPLGRNDKSHSEANQRSVSSRTK